MLQLAAWGWGVVCLYSTNNSQRWAGREQGRAGRGIGVGRLAGFKGAVVHLPGPPLGLTRCESLLGGIVNATELITSCYLYAAFTGSHGCVTCTAKVAELGRNQEQSCKEVQSSDALELFATFKNRCGVKGPLLKQ